jgi:uncharacterized protein
MPLPQSPDRSPSLPPVAQARAPLRRRPSRVAGSLAAAAASGFLLLNAAAFVHARALTRFLPGQRRTEAPQRLSWREKLWVLATGAEVPRPRNTRTPADIGLKFHMRALRGHKGIPLEAWVIPTDSPRGLVVMFHGHADSKDSLLPAARAFHSLGVTPMLVDFYGSGGSGGSDTSVGYYEADDVAAACAYAERIADHKPIVLFGGSMGAAAILRAMDVYHLSPRAIILEAPFDRLSTTVAHRFHAMGFPAFPSAQLLVFWGGVQQGYNGFRFNPVDNAAAVSVPTLLMSGESDPWVTPSETRAILARLSGPKCIEMFPGVGHQCLLRAQPERWRTAVQRFLMHHVDD